jgi:hypothetical protein
MKPLTDHVYSFIYLTVSLIKRRALLHILCLSLSILVGYTAQPHADFTKLSLLIESLQYTSAAVFTLAGLWIAYSYPQAIAAYTKQNKVSLLVGIKETDRIESLVLVILSSAFVLISIIFYNLIATLYIGTRVISNNIETFQLLSISFIMYLLLIQVRAVLFVMHSNMEFVNDLHSKKTELEADNDL